jgi:hypothetical protein
MDLAVSKFRETRSENRMIAVRREVEVRETYASVGWP